MSLRRNIRSRRGSNFIPVTPEFTTEGLLFDWHVTPDKVTLVDDAGTPRISALTDSGPNAVNLTQATGSRQPEYSATALNGRPAARINRTREDVLRNAAGPALAASAGSITAYLAFGTQTRDSGSRSMIGNSGNGLEFYPVSSTHGPSIFKGSLLKFGDGVDAVTGNQVFVVTISPTECRAYRNGRLISAKAGITLLAFGSAYSMGGHHSGATGASLTADVGRIRVYAGVHSDTIRHQNERAFHAEYGFGTSDNLCRVMWVGDSITESSGASQAQWRDQLQALFAAEEGPRIYHPVGPRFGLELSSGDLDDYCYGVSGATSLELATTHAATYLDAWNPAFTPNLIPILAGTNDTGTFTALEMVDNVTALLTDLSTRYPDALLVLQKLLPRSDARDLIVQEWNNDLHDGVVAAAVANGIRVISDSTIADDTNIVRYDGTHPNTAAGALMATDYFPVVKYWMRRA